MKTRLSLICAAVLLPALCFAAPVQWTVAQGGNDHWYERIGYTGLSWEQANVAAFQMSYSGLAGHLATMATPGEYEWLVAAFPNHEYCWLGGYQPEGSAEPAGGWTWVTGEPWVDTDARWLIAINPFVSSRQPDNGCRTCYPDLVPCNCPGAEQNYMRSDSFSYGDVYLPGWNDVLNVPDPAAGATFDAGYFVEYEPTIVDAPAINWGNMKSLFR